jgi:hypothetical protein
VQVVEGINCLWVDERNVHECPICSSAFSFFRRKVPAPIAALLLPSCHHHSVFSP